MPLAFLLAMQASGMVVDWLGKNEQVRLGKLGNQVEQAGIASNIQMSRLETEEASLASMKQLRMNLGTQAAVMASRGISGASGANIFGTAESVGNYNADQRIRKINQISNETNMKANGILSNLHQKTFENKTWNEFRTNTINKIPTSSSAWGKIRDGFSAKSNYGFGLSKVGS